MKEKEIMKTLAFSKKRSTLMKSISGDEGNMSVSTIPTIPVDYSNKYLANTDSSGSGDFSYANFSNSILIGATFLDVNLRYANFSNANLRYANLQGADLRGANLTGANLRYANLQGANLQLANCKDANLSYAKLLNANFCLSYTKNANFSYAEDYNSCQLF